MIDSLGFLTFLWLILWVILFLSFCLMYPLLNEIRLIQKPPTKKRKTRKLRTRRNNEVFLHWMTWRVLAKFCRKTRKNEKCHLFSLWASNGVWLLILSIPIPLALLTIQELFCDEIAFLWPLLSLSFLGIYTIMATPWLKNNACAFNMVLKLPNITFFLKALGI